MSFASMASNCCLSTFTSTSLTLVKYLAIVVIAQPGDAYKLSQCPHGYLSVIWY
jgi:hypothetical protein